MKRRFKHFLEMKLRYHVIRCMGAVVWLAKDRPDYWGAPK
jgi:hypothetical protein